MSDDVLTKRPIPYEEAQAALSRLIASHFRRGDTECGRFSIPARPDHDDDLVLSAHLRQRDDELASLRSTIATLQAELVKQRAAARKAEDRALQLINEADDRKSALAAANARIGELEAAGSRLGDTAIDAVLTSMESSTSFHEMLKKLSDALARAERAEAKVEELEAAAKIKVDQVPAEDEIKQSKRMLYIQIKALQSAAHTHLHRALRAEAKVKELRAALTELVVTAEHDLKLNQADDSAGWWSLKNENAIRKARAALQSCDAPAKTVGEG